MSHITSEGRCSNCDEPLREFESQANKLAIERQHEMEAARAECLKMTERVKELEKQLAEAQAACAEMRQFLENLPKGNKPGRVLLSAYDLDDIERLLSSTCGQSLLNVLTSARTALEQVAKCDKGWGHSIASEPWAAQIAREWLTHHPK